MQSLRRKKAQQQQSSSSSSSSSKQKKKNATSTPRTVAIGATPTTVGTTAGSSPPPPPPPAPNASSSPPAPGRLLFSRTLSLVRRPSSSTTNANKNASTTSSSSTDVDTSTLSATSSTLLLQHLQVHSSSELNGIAPTHDASFEVVTEESQQAWQQQQHEIRRQLFGDDDSIHQKLHRTGTSVSTATEERCGPERNDSWPNHNNPKPTPPPTQLPPPLSPTQSAAPSSHDGHFTTRSATPNDRAAVQFLLAPFETKVSVVNEHCDKDRTMASKSSRDHPDDEEAPLPPTNHHPGNFHVRVVTPSTPSTTAFSLDASSISARTTVPGAVQAPQFVPVGAASSSTPRSTSPPPPPPPPLSSAPQPQQHQQPPPPPPAPTGPVLLPPRAPSLSARVASHLLTNRFCDAQQQLRSSHLASFDTLDTNLSPILASRPEYCLEDSVEVDELSRAGMATTGAVSTALTTPSVVPSGGGAALPSDLKTVGSGEEAKDVDGAELRDGPDLYPVLRQLESLRDKVSDLWSNCQLYPHAQSSAAATAAANGETNDANTNTNRSTNSNSANDKGPPIANMAQKSESFLMDLFYDPSQAWWNCAGGGGGADANGGDGPCSFFSRHRTRGGAGPNGKAVIDRPYYDQEFTLKFLNRLLTDGFTLLLWQPPLSPPRATSSTNAKAGATPAPASADWTGRTVHLVLEPGAPSGDGPLPTAPGKTPATAADAATAVAGPRLEWTTVPGGYEFEISTSGVDLLDVLSIRCRRDQDRATSTDPALTDEEEEDDTTTCGTNDEYDEDDGDSQQTGTASSSLRSFMGPTTKGSSGRGGGSGTTDEQDPCFFTLTTKTGRVHVFEAASPRERDDLVNGLRNAIAWLSYHLVTGDVSASSVLYRPDAVSPNDPDPAELPVLARRPYLAMNRTAHALLD